MGSVHYGKPGQVGALNVEAAETLYQESNSDSGVVLLYKFDEGSGNLVDEISAIAVVHAGSGTTYGTTSTGIYADLSPGVTFDGNGAFLKGSSAPTVAAGTGDQVIEWWFSTSYTAFQAPWGLNDATFKGTQFYFRFAGPSSSVYMEAADGTAQSFNLTLDGSYADDVLHKARYVMDRDGNLELFIDGVSQGTAACTVGPTKTINCPDVEIATYHAAAGAEMWRGVLTTLRVTNGNLAANLGGPNGG